MKKICKICGQEFETIKNGHTRKYCYNCHAEIHEELDNKNRNITNI